MKKFTNLAEFIPGLLVGMRVRFLHQQGGPVGEVLAVGHWYGPGDCNDQAMVRWRCKARPGQRYGKGKRMPDNLEWDSSSVHYMENLDLDNPPKNPNS